MRRLKTRPTTGIGVGGLQVQLAHEPSAEDGGFTGLAGPARPVEHGQSQRQGVVLASAVARHLEMPVIVLEHLDAPPGDLFILNPRRLTKSFECTFIGRAVVV